MSKKENVRTAEIKSLILMITITAIIGIATLTFYITRDKSKFITYSEKSDIDYKVYLKENDFYKEKYLVKGKGYIANLIDSIATNFKYHLDFSDKLKYRYSYRISVEVDVEDEKSKNNIYHFSEDLVKTKLKSNSGSLNISEELKVKYGDYNNLISRFKDVYELNNTTSTLNLSLYVNIENINHSNNNSLKERKVSTLSIPLTENTVSIDINDNSITNTNKELLLTSSNNNSLILFISIFYLTISMIYIIYLMIYIRRTRTAQMIYEKEIKSIINNYDSYIQKITETYDIGTSQVLKIETFNDMLEIHDTLNQPILMLENKEKDGTFFIIPASNSIIYTYALRVEDIRAKMEGKEIPTYDITEIPHIDFQKKKKYTDKYIKDQITMTTSMPTVDEKNIIKGNKGQDENLYKQLEMTSSFDIKEIKKAKKRLEKESAKKKSNKNSKIK